MDKAQFRKLFSESMKKAENAEPESMEDILVLRLTGLTPAQILELKKRDTAKRPIQTEDGMVCPECGSKALPWQKHCDECGQRFWEEGR